MNHLDADSYSDLELEAEFARLFPQGFAGADVLGEIAPEGWGNSPLLAAFHPSLEQVYRETVQVCRNIASLRRPDDRRPLPPDPPLEEVAKDYRPRPVEAEREVRELVGKCLWDVFSDNHQVIAPDGRRLDLGSFRASGGFLADLANRESASETCDYMDFYMGAGWIAQRADLTPVYRMIFRRLRARRLDWVYSFPRIHAVDLRPLTESLKPPDEPEWADYSPSDALAQEEADRQHDRELADLRDSLDEAHRESVEQARHDPPPATVRAYQAVYGSLPPGWPPALP